MAKLSDAEIAALVGRFSGEQGASAKRQAEGSNFASPYADGSVSRAYPAPSFEELPAYRRLEVQLKVGKATGVTQPFFMVHEGCAHATTVVDGRTLLNFSTYDYLGLNGDPRVNAAALAAMERYGTSASASRLVAGERPVHCELEQALAAHYGTKDALVFVSGYATNVTVLASLFDKGDIIFEDALVHNSIVTGAVSSGATRVGIAGFSRCICAPSEATRRGAAPAHTARPRAAMSAATKVSIDFIVYTLSFAILPRGPSRRRVRAQDCL